MNLENFENALDKAGEVRLQYKSIDNAVAQRITKENSLKPQRY